MAGVSSRSITWFSRVKPRPRTTFLCFCGAQIADRTHLSCILPAVFFFSAVIAYNSSTALPRSAATASRFFSLRRASNVALTTLCGLVVPMDLVSTFCTPAEVITARTAPPAITPVPSGAGFSSTMPEPYPTTAAVGSPTTTSAAKERFLPPFTTLVTRLMETTWSLSWYWPGSSFLITVGIRDSLPIPVWRGRPRPRLLKLQPRLPCRIRQGFDPAVVQVAAAIEDHLLNALLLRPLGHLLAHFLGRGQVAPGLALALLALGGTGKHQGLAFHIVHQLHVNMIQRPVHVQAQPFRRTHHLLADALVYSLPCVVFRC